MLMLLFHIGEKRYALQCEHVVEVIPQVTLTSLAHTPDYVTGLLNYRGVPIPVVDLCQLVEGRFSSSRLHTRIIVLEVPESKGRVHMLGLVAERVTEAVKLERSLFTDTGIAIQEAPYLDGIMTKKNSLIQLMLIEPLLEMLQGVLLSDWESKE